MRQPVGKTLENIGVKLFQFLFDKSEFIPKFIIYSKPHKINTKRRNIRKNITVY
ncbi:MAG: hypothetical protein QME57_04715 [Patescibacteria group bacterium]|nr:hypothetical protein [Patescibacteria group bacterium]